MRNPWPSDEPRFALVAKQMVDSGKWLVPMRGEELYADKPPLFLWSQAAAYELVGSWPVAFLLPSLLAALATLWLVYDLSRRLWGSRAAAMATIALLFTLQFTYQAKRAQIDPLALAWIALASYGLLRHLLQGPAWRWYLIGCMAAGLGVITKGVGVLALLLVPLYFVGRALRLRRLSTIPPGSWWRWLVGAVAFVLPIAAWLGPVFWQVEHSGDPAYRAYVQDLLWRQTAQRYVDPGHHLHGPGFYLGIMATMWIPLNLAWPWVVPAWWRRLRWRRDARFALPLAWVVLVIAFFMLSPGKRDVYLMPCLPLLAWATAPYLPLLLRRRGVHRLAFAVAMLLGGVLLIAGLVAAFGDPAFAVKQEQARDWPAHDPVRWLWLAAMGAALLLPLAWLRVRRGAQALVVGLAGLWLVYSFALVPLLDEASSARPLMQRARAAAGDGVTLGLVGWKEQNLLQATGPVRAFPFSHTFAEQRAAAVPWLRADSQRRALFVRDGAMGPCFDVTRAQALGRANHRAWYLVRADAVIDGCDFGAVAPEDRQSRWDEGAPDDD